MSSYLESNAEDDPFEFENENQINNGTEVATAATTAATTLNSSHSSSNNNPVNTIGSNSSSALALILREDPLLLQHDMVSSYTVSSTDEIKEENQVHKVNEEASFAYAASLIHEAHELNQFWSEEKEEAKISTAHVQQRATDALFDVERKLGLIQSLYLRVARDHPEHVSGTLLEYHGHFDYHMPPPLDPQKKDSKHSTTAPTTNSTPKPSLLATRERCDRLKRQGVVLEHVATRVESSLQKGLTKLQITTNRLERILQLSATLKMAMRLRFEAKKVQGSGILDTLASSTSTQTNSTYQRHTQVDLRDLTRAAASVAAMEELLSHPDLLLTDVGQEKNRTTQNQDYHRDQTKSTIAIVEQMRPQATKVALAVRRAAAGLLAEQQNLHNTTTNPSYSNPTNISKLGATLQVYYHLGELPQAVWGAVIQGLAAAEKAASQFFNPAALQRLQESATADARVQKEIHSKHLPKSTSSNNINDNSKDPSNDKDTNISKTTSMERTTQIKLREKRAEAAHKWAMAVGEASMKMWNLHRVLSRKADPVSRQNFLTVVANASVPEKFKEAEIHLRQNLSSKNSNTTPTKQVIPNHLFSIYWNQVCLALGARIQRLLKYDNGSIARDVAALYPSVRAAALDMLVGLNDQMQVGGGNSNTKTSSSNDSSGMSWMEDPTGNSGTMGILGGSSGLQDSVFMGSSSDSIVLDSASLLGTISHSNGSNAGGAGSASHMEGGGFIVGADAWTHEPHLIDDGTHDVDPSVHGVGRILTGVAPSSSSSVISGAEWKAMEDYEDMGLFPLRRAFLEASCERLFAPLQYLFPPAVSVDDHGNTTPILPTLPTRYDIGKLDVCIREELSYADPREGGGDLGMTSMISDNIVNMVARFAISARDAISGAGEQDYLHQDGSCSQALMHDQKLMTTLNTLSTFLKNAPDKTFVIPYRPAVSPQHEEASRLCQIALQPALQEIDGLVKKMILVPLCRALNNRISSAIANMHRGIYLENAMQDPMDASAGGSFVQSQLNSLYDQIANQHLSKLPTEYAGIVSRIVASYSIYTFVSNISLVRPLGEMGRLRITQDLADFELALEQLVVKGGGTITLAQIDRGRAYAELRSIRQMLFWTGFENENATSAFVCKNLLRENWIKDVRPSTIFHFLLTFAPNLLSSPHHSKRMSPEEYVKTLVNYNGSFDDNETSAWMTMMACCDAYQQRESVDGGSHADGDKRVASVLMLLGPELLRRRRQ